LVLHLVCFYKAYCILAMRYCHVTDGGLTPWRPVYEYFLSGNQPKTSSFRLPYQLHSSSADCIRKLFKPSKDSSLLVCTRKKIF